MDNAELSVMRAKVRNHVIPTDRDDLVRSHIREMLENVEDIRNGGGSRKRSLFVMGNSGCGKSFALRNLLGEFDTLQKSQDEFGRSQTPLVSIEAPNPCGMVELCNAVLSELGLPESYSMRPPFATALLKRVLSEHGVIFLHIDEAQHLLRHPTAREAKRIAEQLKSLVQTKDWPLHTIYSGVPELSKLLEAYDRQVNNRSYIRRMSPLIIPVELGLVREILDKVSIELCDLRLHNEIVSEDFLGRICHASAREFGTIIETVQEASFMAVKNSHPVLEVRHFARYFERHTGCLENDNVFTTKDWMTVDLTKLLSDMTIQGGSRR